MITRAALWVVTSIVVALLSQLLTAHAYASTVRCLTEVAPAIEDIPHINPDRALSYAILEGEILPGDGQAVVDGLARLRCSEQGLFLLLDSPGGNFAAAIRIATYLRRFGIGTIIAENARCLSACSIIFMSGSQPAYDGFMNTERWMHYTAKLGFHAPFIDTSQFDELPPEAFKRLTLAAYESALDSAAKLIVLAMHSEWKASLIRIMLQTSKDSMYFVDTVDKAGRWQIGVYGLPTTDVRSDSEFRRMCLNFYFWSPEREPFRTADEDGSFDDFGLDVPPPAELSKQFNAWLADEDFELARTFEGDKEIVRLKYVMDGPECEFFIEKGKITEGNGWSNEGKGLRHGLRQINIIPGYIKLSDARKYLEDENSKMVASPVWNHNGSLMSIEVTPGANDTRNIVIRYAVPKKGLERIGIVMDTVLLQGSIVGTRVIARATVFSGKCGPMTYSVSGEYDDKHMLLSGPSPKRDANCNLRRLENAGSNSRLEFTRQD